MAATTGLEQNSSFLKASSRPGPSGFLPNSDISAPAINDLPAPVSTTPITSGSFSAFVILSTKPALTPSLSGFTGGLSTVNRATPSFTS